MSRIERFQLEDQDGNIHDAVKITPIRKVRGTNETMEGTPSFKLSTGEHLNPDGDGFKAIFSGHILKYPAND